MKCTSCGTTTWNNDLPMCSSCYTRAWRKVVRRPVTFGKQLELFGSGHTAARFGSAKRQAQIDAESR